MQGDDLNYSDPRGYARIRMDSSSPVGSLRYYINDKKKLQFCSSVYGESRQRSQARDTEYKAQKETQQGNRYRIKQD